MPPYRIPRLTHREGQDDGSEHTGAVSIKVAFVSQVSARTANVVAMFTKNEAMLGRKDLWSERGTRFPHGPDVRMR